MNRQTTDITFYEAIRRRLGDKETEAVVNFIDAKLKVNNESNLKMFTAKDDITDLKLQLSGIKEDMAGLKRDVRWLYALVMPLLLAILGLYFKN